MGKVDLVTFKMYSYDADYFNQQVASRYKNSIIINFDFDKVWIQYKPWNINLKKEKINLLAIRTGNENIDYYLLPFVTTVNLFIYFRLILTICLKFRPRVLLVEHTYVAIFAGIMKKCKLCEKSIYAATDWIANDKNRKQLLSHIHCNLIFPFLDALACKINDVVLNYAKPIAEARDRFWGKKIAKKEKPYLYKPRIAVNSTFVNKKSNNICFIGNMKEYSGLDMAIKSLSKIRRQQDSSLVIIGQKGQNYEYFRKLTKECHVEAYVEFLGSIETEKLPEILDDCFCGINILISLNSYSNYAIPGKQIHYLQFLLPIITTEGAGTLVSVIKEKALGIVIEPSEDAFIDAVSKIYNEQKQYRENIVQYINTIPETDIKELIES